MLTDDRFIYIKDVFDMSDVSIFSQNTLERFLRYNIVQINCLFQFNTCPLSRFLGFDLSITQNAAVCNNKVFLHRIHNRIFPPAKGLPKAPINNRLDPCQPLRRPRRLNVSKFIASEAS